MPEMPTGMWEVVVQAPFVVLCFWLIFSTDRKLDRLNDTVSKMSERVTRLATLVSIKMKVEGENDS